MFCIKCGKPLPDGARFCTGCGTPVNAAGASPAYNAAPGYTAPAYHTAPMNPAPAAAPANPAPAYNPAPAQGNPLPAYNAAPGYTASAYNPAPAPAYNAAPGYTAPAYNPAPATAYNAAPAYGADPRGDAMSVFSMIPVRYVCPNGHVFDGGPNAPACPNCGAPLPPGGYIQMYRKGNYMGCAVGMGIYIDNVPYGHIDNTRSLRLFVPYGAHKVHVTHTTTRKCNDPVFVVSPENPYVFCKAHFSKAGFAIAVEPAAQADMPTK